MSTPTTDPEFYQAPKYTPESQQPPRQHGCFFYGCIIASILMALVAILIAVVIYFSFRFVNQLVEEYTDTAPRELPKVEMPVDRREALTKRVEDFRKAVQEGKAVEPLVLTSDDLNALIEEQPDLKGRIHVRIEGSELKGQVSIPLERFSQVPFLGMLKGRYLNGEADLKASFSEGVLIVTLDGFEVNGKRPPEEIMAKIRQQNLAKDAYNDPKNAEMLRKVESMEIKDGKITIKVRAKPSESTEKKAAETVGKAAEKAAEKSTEKPADNSAPAKEAPPKEPAPASKKND
jgi:hypothetical protein